MKTVIFSVTIFFLISYVHGGVFYGEKENAIQEVEKRWNEAYKKIQEEINTGDSEINDIDRTLEDKEISNGKNKLTENQNLFQTNVVATTKSAIAKNKPLAAFECIERTNAEGNSAVAEVHKNYEKFIKDVIIKKIEGVKFLQSILKLTQTGLEELVKESIEKLNEAKTGYDAIKVNALNKIKTVEKEIQEINDKIHKPAIKDEYIILKKQNENKYKEVNDALLKKLQKCIP